MGHVRSSRVEPYDDGWDAEVTSIELDSEVFDETALLGLEAFSHVEVIYLFDRVPPDRIEYGARHPRGKTNWPAVGIFAQRAKNRPNRIGASICRIIEVSGTTVRVGQLDAVDGTPVLDLKPYLIEFGPRGDVIQPPWSSQLMHGYW